MCHMGRDGFGVSHGEEVTWGGRGLVCHVWREGGVWSVMCGGRSLVCHMGREGSGVSCMAGQMVGVGGVWCREGMQLCLISGRTFHLIFCVVSSCTISTMKSSM